MKVNKVITIKIDVAQDRPIGRFVDALVDWVTELCDLLGIEVFIETLDEEYGNG